jgi:hypothetical protein
VKRQIGPVLLLFILCFICRALIACEATAHWRETVTYTIDPKFSKASSVLERHKDELAADAGSDNLVLCDLSATKEGQPSIELGVKHVTPELLSKVPREIEGVPIDVKQIPEAQLPHSPGATSGLP